MSAPSRFRRLVPDTRLTGEGQWTRPWLLYLSIPVALVNRAIPRRVLAWLVERLGLGPLLGTVLSGLSGFVVGVLVVIGLFAAVDVVAGDRLPTIENRVEPFGTALFVVVFLTAFFVTVTLGVVFEFVRTVTNAGSSFGTLGVLGPVGNSLLWNLLIVGPSAVFIGLQFFGEEGDGEGSDGGSDGETGAEAGNVVENANAD